MVRLVPQRSEFFELYRQAGANAVAIARALVELLERFPDTANLSWDIKELEHEGDRLTYDVVDLLNRTFVTPFDREDMYRLAGALDDICDHIDEAAGNILGYGVESIRARAREQAEVLHRATGKIEEAVGLLQGFKDSRRQLNELREEPLGGNSARVGDFLLILVVVVALGFDFTNGFHDTANAVATSVSTRALSPRTAVFVAAVANLAGAFVTTAVAKTVGQGIIDTGLATDKTVLAALLGAIAWNLITWWFGLPSSSSHALIGGLVGAALVQSGSTGVQWHGLVHNVMIPAMAAPVIAFAGAFLLLIAIFWLFAWMTSGVANRTFRFGQLASGTFMAFTHGANDAQKTMGVIALALFTHGTISDCYIPTWVKIARAV